MENQLPIHKILSWMFIVLSISFLHILLFSNTTNENNPLFYARIGQIIGLGAGGIFGLVNWKIARWWLMISFLGLIIYMGYDFYIDWQNSKNETSVVRFFQGEWDIFLLEVSVLMDSIFSFLMIGTGFILFNEKVYPFSSTDKNWRLHHLSIHKIISLIVFSFGLSFLFSIYSPVIFDGKDWNEVDYSWIKMVPICMGIGVLSWFYWKVIRVLLILFLIFLYGSVVYFTILNEGIDVFTLVQAVLWGCFLVGMFLIFLNKNTITTRPAVAFHHEDDENILDAF